MHVAIITKSATTHSGARAPIDLASALRKSCDVTIFAEAKNAQKDLKSKLKKLKLYKNPMHLYQLLKLGDFDVISFHSTFLEMIAAKLTGIPIVRTYYGTQFDAYLEKFLPDQKPDISAKIINSFANFAIWANQKFMLLLSNQVIAISIATQKELKKLYGKESRVIYLGSNLKPTMDYRLRTTAVDSRQSTIDKVTVLSVSRITPYKGFHRLIGIVKNIRKEGTSVKLIIAGSGEKKNYLQYLLKIKDKDDRIIVNPSDQTLKGLYRQCDIVASCDRYPFFGLTLLEAAQFAKPAIVLNYLAASELITHGKTGFVANSLEEFKNNLVILIKNKQKRLQMAKASQVISQEKFGLEKIAKSYTEVFTSFAFPVILRGETTKDL